MISQIIKKFAPLTLSNKGGFAQDWSHIYDGIYRFEDNSLGE